MARKKASSVTRTESAQRLMLLRKGSGLTQDELAAALGVSKALVSRLELDGTPSGLKLNDRTIELYSRFFKCNPAYLTAGAAFDRALMDHPEETAYSDLLDLALPEFLNATVPETEFSAAYNEAKAAIERIVVRHGGKPRSGAVVYMD